LAEGKSRPTPPDGDHHRLTLLERASREAGAQLSLAMEALGDGCVVFDADDRLACCNQRYREIYPISAPAIVEGARFEDIVRYGLEHGEYVVPEGQEAAWLAARLALHRQAYAALEQELAGGRWVQIIEQATPEGGRIGLRIDITERKRQEAAALQAKRQLEATLRAIPDLMFEVDREGRFIACHVSDPRRLLVPPEELVGKSITATLPADAARICHAAIDEALSTGISTGMQYRLEGFDGGEWFELSVARKDADVDPPGEPTLIALVRDITERKRLEQSLAAERDFLDQIMATSPSAIVVIDASGQLVFANQAAERVMRVSAASGSGRCFDDPALRITTFDGNPYPMEQLPCTAVLRTGQPVHDVRFAIEWPDGRRVMLSVNATPLAAASDAPRGVVCSITDITDQLAAETALRQNEALLRGLFELCPMGIALTDLETGAFLDVNEAVLRQLGYSRDELLQLTYLDITPEQYQARDRNNQVSLVKGGRYTPHEKENIRKDGSRFPVLLNTTVVTDGNGRKLLWSIVEDISERKANEAQILRQAHYDELTGLPNRRLFQERLEQALERARRGRHIGAVAMLDLDHFKTINDSLGHKAGDQVLIEAANRLRSCTRATDTVARFGGDEFLLLLDDISSPADAEAIVGKIHTILARPFAVDGEKMQLGVSIGVCIFDAEHNDPDTLLRNADKAMYASKSAGRNQTRFFTTVAAMPDHHHPAHRGPAIDRRSPRGQ